MNDPNRLLNKNLLRGIWKESTNASLDVWHLVQEIESEIIDKIEMTFMNSITMGIFQNIKNDEKN